MRYFLINKEETHCMSLKMFTSIVEAEKIKKKYTNYWKKFNLQNPENKSPRYNAWKHSIIKPTLWENNFADYDIVMLSEQKRKCSHRNSNVLKQIDETIINKKVEKHLRLGK